MLKTVPTASLLIKSHKVTRFDDNLHELLYEMFKVMRKNGGIGIAAPQVGYNLRLVVLLDELRRGWGGYDDLLVKSNGSHFIAIVNPEIVTHSDDLCDLVNGEGCLSLPMAQAGKVLRFRDINLKYQNYKGEMYQTKLDGTTAAIVQHEIDHLDGILYPARMEHSSMKKLLALYARRHLINYDIIDRFISAMERNLNNNPLSDEYSKEELVEFARELDIGEDEVEELYGRIISINGTA